MAAAPRFPRLLLLGTGCLLVVAGAAGAGAGLLVPGRLHALLPAVVVDAAAIGGAAVALGAVVATLGAAQLLIGLLLERAGWTAAGVVSLGVLAALLVALGVVLLTEVAAGAAGWVVAPAAVLLLLAGLYGAAAWHLATAPARGPTGPGNPG
jgi:hypothetical protein